MVLGVRTRSRDILVLALLAASATSAGAAKLKTDACNELKDELVVVLAAGAPDDMRRGPAWAEANLDLDRLNNIKRLIELEEQLQFRCGVADARVAAIARARKLQRDAPPELPERNPSRITAEAKLTPAGIDAPSSPRKVTSTVPGTQGAGTQKRVQADSKGKRAYVSPQKISPYVVMPLGANE